jgi:DnaA-homolog protein
MTEQLTLGLELHEDTTFENYYVGNNDQLLTILQAIARGRGEQFVYLWGASGVGKTHLLQACCHAANQLKLSPLYLSFKNIEQLQPDVLDGLENLHLVCIDDVNVMAGRPAWEEAFFHLYNRMREENKRLIVAGSVPPQELGLALKDLVSRLAWGIALPVTELKDEEKMQAIMTRAKARGLPVSQSVAKFLLNRWPRDMASLFKALSQLDHASLAAKRRLTIPFVKEALSL